MKYQAYLMDLFFSKKISNNREGPKVSLPILYQTPLTQLRFLVAHTIGSEINSTL